ncbi:MULTISPECIES: hypothetical protein [unclassified Lactococcus]|uniref:hypothetical protein n=1 Tax=unclassified Lactococcus TaxID=2643510 RepID=UPI0011CA203D|nr:MULTISPECIES: hypothetical protein [unclassified Lactococcus]MQW23669.1 hypothetical protein [Lactococcus sp. dk101]TXK37598.1 hypothetical protein FVP42_08100 [Lactococcus sp. dk310]TXK49036.1 hypothetical protein FVP43_08070 [Lactococcus sp. dk322]
MLKKSLICLSALTGLAFMSSPMLVHADTPENTVPVYCLARGNDHYLTTVYDTARNLVANQGYSNMQIIAYAPTTGLQVHNWYNSAQAIHMYTTDNADTERARLTALGYTEFNTSNLYSAAATDNGATPVYRSFNGVANHYYSLETAMPAGYMSQTIGWYAYYGPKLNSSGIKTVTADTGETVDLTTLGQPTTTLSANVSLAGTGTGYESKIELWDNSHIGNEVSLALQKDDHATGGLNYSGKVAILTENVGTDHHIYTDWAIASQGLTATNVPLTISYYANSGVLVYYAYGEPIGASTNQTFTAPYLYGAEVNVEHNGDTVSASVNDINVPTGNVNILSGYHYASPAMPGTPLVLGDLTDTGNFNVSWNNIVGTGMTGDWDSNIPLPSNTVYFVSN